MQLNALNPPMDSSAPGWHDFDAYVLSSSYIHGVNPYIAWSNIETSQQHYDFTTLDSQILNFSNAGKKVNLIFQPISFSAINNPTGGVNTDTPAYVFTQAWANSVGQANPLDVVTCPPDYPGNGDPTSGYPVVYEAPFQVAYQQFITAVLTHYANQSSIGYIRFGLSVGDEANPYCTTQLPIVPPSADFFGTWTTYVSDMDSFEKSQSPTMQVMQSLNRIGGDPTDSVPDFEALSAAQNGFGFGSNGLQASDITNYAAGKPCASNWCAMFDQYAVPLELQQATPSDPTNSPQNITGSLVNLIPFAASRHATIIEIKLTDLFLALDPNYMNTAGANAAYAPFASAYQKVLADPCSSQ